ncbi:HEAT repeat domain-containing protein [Brevibacterium samyangense]|uniref:HEAT repeat domain-containing protein n=1 Tax=Brevibacterium samyangense TaxID=366888 RepID=A0ABN2T6W1_9MICO
MTEPTHGSDRIVPPPVGVQGSRDPERRAAIARALAAGGSSTRLQSVLALGTRPDPEAVVPLVERCAVEPDFYVRDMLTWALTRHSTEAVLPLVLAQLRSTVPQARSQALHTLSKLGDRATWPEVTEDLLADPDDEVARAAWRTAAGLAPHEEWGALAEILATQLGRGGRDVQLSLSRALGMLGDAGRPVLERVRDAGGRVDVARGSAEARDDPAAVTGAEVRTGSEERDGAGVRGASDVVLAHTLATLRMLDDPEAGFVLDVEEAKRVRALGRFAPELRAEPTPSANPGRASTPRSAGRQGPALPTA